MSRAALLFVGATVTAACGGQTESPSLGGDAAASEAGGGDDTDAQPVAMYGPAPVQDAGPREASPDAPADAPSDADSGGLPVMYGPAPIDAG
jgi:hypothetical protein